VNLRFQKAPWFDPALLDELSKNPVLKSNSAPHFHEGDSSLPDPSVGRRNGHRKNTRRFDDIDEPFVGVAWNIVLPQLPDCHE
jgi:hypothetical protein